MADNPFKKNIIVTGAAGFLGSFFCDYLTQNREYIVYALDKNEKKLKSLKNKIKRQNIKFIKIDITSESKVKNFFLKIYKKKKLKVYAIINNAAIDSIPASKKKINLATDNNNVRRDVNVSIVGTNNLICSSLPYFDNNENGKIINIGSDLSLIAPDQRIYEGIFDGYTKPLSYSITKHALLGLTKYYASLLAKDNISVNMMSPGPIFNNHPKKFYNKIAKVIPMERMGIPSDLFTTIDYLLNNNTKFVTGQNILIDGGRTII